MRMMTECSFLGELLLEVAFNTKPLRMCHVKLCHKTSILWTENKKNLLILYYLQNHLYWLDERFVELVNKLSGYLGLSFVSGSVSVLHIGSTTYMSTLVSQD